MNAWDTIGRWGVELDCHVANANQRYFGVGDRRDRPRAKPQHTHTTDTPTAVTYRRLIFTGWLTFPTVVAVAGIWLAGGAAGVGLDGVAPYIGGASIFIWTAAVVGVLDGYWRWVTVRSALKREGRLGATDATAQRRLRLAGINTGTLIWQLLAASALGALVVRG